MEKIVKQGLLYDFYGDLLTEHQKKIYEEVVFRDFSLSEIAEEAGISRQGVHDLIKRCDKILLDYESKLHLLEKSTALKSVMESISRLSAVSFDSQRRDEDKVTELTDKMSEIHKIALKFMEDQNGI